MTASVTSQGSNPELLVSFIEDLLPGTHSSPESSTSPLSETSESSFTAFTQLQVNVINHASHDSSVSSSAAFNAAVISLLTKEKEESIFSMLLPLSGQIFNARASFMINGVRSEKYKRLTDSQDDSGRSSSASITGPSAAFINNTHISKKQKKASVKSVTESSRTEGQKPSRRSRGFKGHSISTSPLLSSGALNQIQH